MRDSSAARREYATIRLGERLLGWLRRPSIGTRSVLYGAHCFLLHPWFVAWAWWRLYGFPWDPRLWVAFFVHDLGYIGKPNMDGAEGESHPEWGARLMHRLFDRGEDAWERAKAGAFIGTDGDRPWINLGTWGRLVLLHSRFYARRTGLRPSRLCYADKLAIVLTPAWLYLPMATLTGEVYEYMELARQAGDGEGKYAGENTAHADPRRWYRQMQEFLRGWLDENLPEGVSR